MPLGEDEEDSNRSRFCGVETHFNKSTSQILDEHVNIVGGFDYVVVPLMSPTYRPSLVQQFGSFSLEPRLPYAKSDLNPLPTLWHTHVIGKISEWIDLDSTDEILRKDSETAFKQEIAWASYLSLDACILPTPKGNTCTNYARCANQILQEHKKEMQLWLRIPLEPDDDSTEISRTPDDYWKIWNSFRLMCDHNSKLLVALDNLSALPSDNSLNNWHGEPIAAFIIHTNSFFTRDGDNVKHLSEGLQKLVTFCLNHSSQVAASPVSEGTTLCSSDRVTRSDIQFLETLLKKKRDRKLKNTAEGRAPCFEALLKASESYGESSSYAAAREARAPCSSDRVTRSFLLEGPAKRNNDRKRTDGGGSGKDEENTAKHWVSKMGLKAANEGHSPKIIISYDYDTLTNEGVPSSSSVAVISAIENPNFMINPGDNGYPIGSNITLLGSIRGLGFGFGDNFHKVFNPIMQITSAAVVDQPPLYEDNITMGVGFDSAHGQYKFLGLFDSEEGDGTYILVYTVNRDEDWRTHEWALVHLVVGPWTPNMGIHISVNNSSILNFLFYKSFPDLPLEEQPYEEVILSFNFESEIITWVSPPVGEEVPAGSPILCGLNDRVCCAYYFANTLTIYQCIIENEYTWEHLFQVNTPQIENVGLFCFLPVYLHNHKLLVSLELSSA